MVDWVELDLQCWVSYLNPTYEIQIYSCISSPKAKPNDSAKRVSVRLLIMEFTNQFKVPAAEIKSRTRNIQKELRHSTIDGVFIVQRVDLFYFSGTAQNGVMYIPAEGEPLLLIKQYLPRAEMESSVANIIAIDSIKEAPQKIVDCYGSLPQVLGFELDVVPVNDFNFYQSLFDVKKCVNASSHILKVRRTKSDWEIAQMANTAEMSRLTYQYMQQIIEPGLTEMEFAGLFETHARKLGHGARIRVRHYQAEGYPWHVLSGSSGSLPGLLDSPASGTGTSAAFPVGAGHKKLSKNEPIMVDLASVLNGYHMDETRMFAMGSMPDKALRVSRAAIEIHDRILEKAKPGATLGELFDISVRLAEKLGVGQYYLGPPGHQVSFIGHGIGLEIVEPYVIARNRRDQLAPGMTFALEPKFVCQNEFTAGVESVFVVTETDSSLISKVPAEVFIR
ncbi:Xaa-Pro aminopeptidase (EC [Olavius algarvensis Delta 1 endosymbiont]|nr:Xaa-Pro aminopeptidase (EC [Olavius algarvensis Delta 1 endosymbiont]